MRLEMIRALLGFAGAGSRPSCVLGGRSLHGARRGTARRVLHRSLGGAVSHEIVDEPLGAFGCFAANLLDPIRRRLIHVHDHLITELVGVFDVLVKFVTGQRPISVRFSDATVRTYASCAETLRQQSLKTLRLVCNFAFVSEYSPSDDPLSLFVIDAEIALSNTHS